MKYGFKILCLLTALLLFSCIRFSKPELGLPTFVPEPNLFCFPAALQDRSMNIKIFSDVSGATIRYTTDGSDPNERSQICNGSMTISFNDTKRVVIRAIAMKRGYKTSRIITVTYDSYIM